MGKKFAKGDRVVSTQEAHDFGLWEETPVFGTVATKSRDPDYVTVVRDGTVTPMGYHIDFWRRATPEEDTP